MRKKIEEFDNYGVDLSKTCQHKTLPGGIFSIIVLAIYFFVIFKDLYGFFQQGNTVKTKFLIDFDSSLAPINFDGQKVKGEIGLTNMSPEQVADLFIHFKLGFEYQTKDKSEESEIILFKCSEIVNSTCIFSFDFQNKYFKYHDLLYHNPKMIFQSCRTLKQKTNIIANKELLNDCISDDKMDAYYNEPYIKGTYFQYKYDLPYFQVSKNGTIEESRKEYSILFEITNENYEDFYTSEINKMNVFYQNKLFSYESHNNSYANWVNPRIIAYEVENNKDYYLNILFSFRLEEEAIHYSITKTSFFVTAVEIGGFLGLFSLILSLNSFWNPYYFTKVLFKVYSISLRENLKQENKNEKDNQNQNSNEEEKEEKKDDDMKEDILNKDKKEEEPIDEKILNIDYANLSYCQWYWLTSCFNCTKRKKMFKRRCAELLANYQCRSCVRNINQSKWYDLSKVMPDDEVDELNFHPAINGGNIKETEPNEEENKKNE